jgi:putative SOS response-associated peptidase YedK
MCGRFALFSPGKDLARGFGLEAEPEVKPRYNIRPTQEILTVVYDSENRRRRSLNVLWGLVPPHVAHIRSAAKSINVRSETVGEKPLFRSAFLSRRCLIPADGFYEWKHQGKQKIPYYFGVRGGEIFAFAGIMRTFCPPDGLTIETAAILTVAANELVADIHDRMPAILQEKDYSLWLGREGETPEGLSRVLKPFPAAEMTVKTVGTEVDKVGYDGPECIAPLKWFGMEL